MFCVPLLVLKNVYFLVDIPLEVMRQKNQLAVSPDRDSRDSQSALMDGPDAALQQARGKLNTLREILLKIKDGTDEQYEDQRGPYGRRTESPVSIARNLPVMRMARRTAMR